jgi:nicotinamide phosphoribosyltransferase
MLSDVSNILYDTDSYNGSHFKMYPLGTTEVSGYVEPRMNSEHNDIAVYGLQYQLKEYLSSHTQRDLSQQNVNKAKRAWENHGLPFNLQAWEILRDELDGKLPIEIQSVPEGFYLPKGNVMMQVRNTDSRFYWLPTWLETTLVQVWYPCNVCTISKEVMIDMYRALQETGCEDIWAVLQFMLHDFGFRGAPCREAAYIGGSAHLVNFWGTDTFAAMRFIDEYYVNSNKFPGEIPTWGYSIPASNHAVIMAFGGVVYEPKAFRHILQTYLKENGIVACVSDTYNLFRALDIWGTEFRDMILNSKGRLVVRPDSGDPTIIAPKAILKLMGYFGYTENAMGYKVLPTCIRLIWGDGTNPAIIKQVLKVLKDNKIAAENIVFGMGAGLLQKHDRDTCSIAFKINERVVNGERKGAQKDPETGHYKASKIGRLALIDYYGKPTTIPEVDLGNYENLLVPTYRNGELLVDWDFREIRDRAKASVEQIVARSVA